MYVKEIHAIMADMDENPRFDAWVIVNTLNRLYERHNFPSLREGARFLVMHKDTLARTLTGTTKQFDPSRVQGMAMRLGASARVAEQLFELAAQTHSSSASGFQELRGAKHAPFALIELGAKRMDVYEDGLIHGLLQTREYMEEVARCYPFENQESAQSSIGNKLERQRAAFEEGEPPEMRVILNEHSLDRLQNTALYEPQIKHMLGLIERHNLGIYVLPVATGIHSTNLGSFTVMGFDHPTEFEVVYVPSVAGAHWVEDAALTDQCQKLFKHTLRKTVELGAYVNADK